MSFDVVSLYTNIPINEAIEFIKRITNPDTAYLVGICLTSTFFSFDGEFYEQTCSVTMGSPLSSVVANLFMEDFESKALAFSRLLPKLWKRFVYDTFFIWSHGKEKLELFFLHLNNQSSSIKFTMEFECNGSLPSLTSSSQGMIMALSFIRYIVRKLIWSNIFMLILIISQVKSLVFSTP